MILSDKQIKQLANQGMIQPFESRQIRSLGDGKRCLSFGLGSYGYDIRLSAAEFKIFSPPRGSEGIVDPKDFDAGFLASVQLRTDERGEFFILPAHTYGLGVAVERLCMPEDVTAICTGKSSYARVGIICNITPAEAGWRGHLTLEISNSCSRPARIYANEGIAQLLFFKGEQCSSHYENRHNGSAGKYQDQGEEIIYARI